MNDMILKIEKAQIVYKNFSGRETMVNRKGNRNFIVRIDGRKANKLKKQGWNIKCSEIKHKKVWFLPVSIKDFYDQDKKPTIYMQIKGDKDDIIVDDSNIRFIDYATIDWSHIEVFGYKWTLNGQSGIKAYLKCALFTINPYVKAHKILSLIKLEELY